MDFDISKTYVEWAHSGFHTDSIICEAQTQTEYRI